VPKIPETIISEITVEVPQDVPRNPITLPQPPPQPKPPEQIATIEKPPPITFSPARALFATHTTPDYPPLSRRLGEQGTLRLKLSITPQGAVADAMVVNSSGHPRLDEAAVDWVKTHWRYQPAMRGPTAVPSTADAVVTFKLQ
jgi:protein TonB